MKSSVSASRPKNNPLFSRAPRASVAVIVVLLAIASLAVYHGGLPTVKAFNEVGSITLNSGENGLHSAVIDEANQLAYFGTASGTVVKIDLATLTEVGSLALSPLTILRLL